MPQETQDAIQSPAMRISNMTVRVLHEYTGRGPTKARTTISATWSWSSCRTRS